MQHIGACGVAEKYCLSHTHTLFFCFICLIICQDGSSRSVFREKLKTTRALSPGLLVQGQHTLLCAGRDILVLRVEDASEIKVRVHAPTSNAGSVTFMR